MYGRPTRLRKPIVAMSMPSAVSQACIAWPVSASGRPEAKPRTVTASEAVQRTSGRGAAIDGSAAAMTIHGFDYR